MVQRSRDRDPLALPSRQADAPLADGGLDSLGQRRDHQVVGVGEQVGHHLVRQRSVERHRVPVPLVQMVAGPDRLVGAPELDREVRIALDTDLQRRAVEQGKREHLAADLEDRHLVPERELLHRTRQRQAGLQRLRVLASACKYMGTSVITLCTGTRDPENMWRWHPENTSPQAWEDLLNSMEAALHIAEEEGIILAFEPERANVINTAARGRALLDAMRSHHLKVIMDPANLIVSGNKQHMHHVLDEAFELLGEDIVLAHAKDVGPDNTFRAAGSGFLDYDYYLHHLDAATVEVPLIIHGLSEAQVDNAVQFLRDRLKRGR